MGCPCNDFALGEGAPAEGIDSTTLGAPDSVFFEEEGDGAIVSLDGTEEGELTSRQTAARIVNVVAPFGILAATAITAKRTRSTLAAITVGIVSWLGFSLVHKAVRGDTPTS